MCTLYNVTTNAEAIRELFGARAGATPNLPPTLEVYPNRPAPVVRASGSERELTTMTWGFPPPPAARAPVVNVRNLSSPFWRTALMKPERRCLVPVTAFSEWTAEPDPATGRKRKVWFELSDAPLFAFAGIWRPVDGEPDRFAFLTCEPNALVGAIHPKAMPVILEPADHAQWLSADYAGACALAKPLPAHRMRVVG